jgi:uncharacterized cupin superfamily protein
MATPHAIPSGEVPRSEKPRPEGREAALYAAGMSNLNDRLEPTADGVHAARIAERAGAEHLGASLYELQPGEEMVFHYHVQREELLIVLKGRLSLRSAAGWEELPEGEVVAFPRGERGAHGYRNDGNERARVLMISEMDGPNISVYPDTNQIGVFDAGQRARRRFGALFNVADAVADYGGLGTAKLVPPAPGPRQARGDAPR